MHLKGIHIEGYKCFRQHFEAEFARGLNVLVGENGVGKSAVIDAIRLLLLEDEFGRSPISETDFYQAFDDKGKHAASFKIVGHFDSLSKEEQVAFLPWTSLDGKASLTLVVDNKQNNLGRYRRAVWGGVSRSAIFEWDLFDTICCVYLPPLRDAEAKLREGKGSRLARLLKNLNRKALKQAQLTSDLHPLEKKVQEFNLELASDKNHSISQANAVIKAKLVEALGTVFGQDTHIQFSEVSFNRIVESLRLLFFPQVNADASPDMFRSLEENSLGYNNLIYLATVLAELTVDEDCAQYLKVLLIEEPEAHLHPQLQIRLLKYLEVVAKEKNVQIIVTTHSPVLASAVSVDTVIHLSHSNSILTSVALRKCGLDKSTAFINRWLDATKSTLLFAKGIIMVEGIAEAMLVPVLAKAILKDHNARLGKNAKLLPVSLEDAGVSVVNMNGIFFNHFMQMFCNLSSDKYQNIPIRCAGITDSDPASTDEDGHPLYPTKSNLLPGKNPALKYVEGINKSEWARLYTNLKTFEYDLALEPGNLSVMLDIAKSLLDTDGPIKAKLTQYINKNMGETSEIERAEAASFLLEHIDKGPFAQTLADRLTATTAALTAPVYIKKAVLWSCGGEFNDA